MNEVVVQVSWSLRSWWHPKTGSRTNFGTLSGCQG